MNTEWSPNGASTGIASKKSDPDDAKMASPCDADSTFDSRYSLDALRVPIEALALRRVLGEAFRQLVQRLAHELVMILAAILVGREAEVQADEGKRTGFQRGQNIHPLTQRLNGHGY